MHLLCIAIIIAWNLSNILLIRQHFIAIQIQVNASNYKINSYKLKLDGTYKRDKTPLPREIVGGRCAVFSTTKMVDPCKPNFWSIGIQGSLYNVDAENGWVFKDKDCQTFVISKLPIVDPDASKPSPSPTASPIVVIIEEPEIMAPSSSPSAAPVSPTAAPVSPTAAPVSPTAAPASPTAAPSRMRGKAAHKRKNGGRKNRYTNWK